MRGHQMEDSIRYLLESYLINLTKSQCLRPIQMDILQPTNSFQRSLLEIMITAVIVIFISFSVGQFHHSTPLGSAGANVRLQTPVNGSSASPPDLSGCGMDHCPAFTETRRVNQTAVSVILTGKQETGKKLYGKPWQRRRSLTATAEMKALMKLQSPLA